MNMEISEDPENLKRNPPSVVVELFDHDTGMVRSVVNLNSFKMPFSCQVVGSLIRKFKDHLKYKNVVKALLILEPYH